MLLEVEACEYWPSGKIFIAKTNDLRFKFIVMRSFKKETIELKVVILYYVSISCIVICSTCFVCT